jgi:hypothetical protein
MNTVIGSQLRGAKPRSGGKCSKCSKRHSKRDKGGARESTGGARERTVGSARTVPYCSFEEIAWIAANGPQIKMPTLKLFGHCFGRKMMIIPHLKWYFHQSPTTFDSLVGSMILFYHTFGSADNTHAR